MTRPKIWYSLAWHTNDSGSSRPIAYGELTDREAGVDIVKAFARGERIDLSLFPDPVYFQYPNISSKVKDNLPDIFRIMYGFVLISERMKAVLEEFDLGQTQIFPVTLYENDQVTPRPDRLFVLNVAERKDGFVPERCQDGEPDNIYGRWSLSPWVRPAVRSHVAEGVDLWFNRDVKEFVFLTDRLAKALRRAQLRGVRLKECVVVTEH